ncbi:MAG: glutathione S-transferase [Alphaproteobacteria bacterium]|nr:glutathione S-transferase [Alphaproteobacteria bacterium]
MKLRYAPTSPYVRKVVVCLHELGLDDRVERIATNVWDPETDIGGTNPLGKVPALVLDDGMVLFDSPVICEYINDLTGGTLFSSGDDRWWALRLEALADGILDAAILRLLEGRRPENLQSADWSARQRRAIDRALDVLEAEVEHWGETPTIGHITAGCALGYLDFRFGHEDWRPGRAKLASWYEAFAARPSMQASVPKDPPA